MLCLTDERDLGGVAWRLGRRGGRGETEDDGEADVAWGEAVIVVSRRFESNLAPPTITSLMPSACVGTGREQK
jgi:hypothetical protein